MPSILLVFLLIPSLGIFTWAFLAQLDFAFNSVALWELHFSSFSVANTSPLLLVISNHLQVNWKQKDHSPPCSNYLNMHCCWCHSLLVLPTCCSPSMFHSHLKTFFFRSILLFSQRKIPFLWTFTVPFRASSMQLSISKFNMN